MPLHNYLTPKTDDHDPIALPLRAADVVFLVTDGPSDGPWRARGVAHVGIAAISYPNHQLNDDVFVIDMDHHVDYSTWSNLESQRRCRVDLSGTIAELDDSVRAAIIDTASEFRDRPIALESLLMHGGYYLMGEASAHSHPLFPGVSEAYAFSCATFAQYCYDKNIPDEVGSLLRNDTIPMATTAELATLQNWLEDDRIQKPLRRIYPAYLAAAFEHDTYPFEPNNWDDWEDHGRYIPDAMRAT